jgi:enoyl-CoA hydratase
MNMQNKSDILFKEIPGKNGSLGLITLNRPEVLNALNQNMFILMHAKLIEWSTASHIKAVVICAAEGRAFCAGGDIRSAYERAKAKDPTLGTFFSDEYQMNRAIYHFPKPYIALMDGITMGGGVGVSIHGSHRVATERYVFAMPETGIGFYPDVGATYFLPRLAHKIGLYLGLTGEKIDCHDALALGLVDHLVAREVFPEIVAKLADISMEKNADAAISDVLNYFTLPPGKSHLLNKQTEIEICFSKETVGEIINTLEHFPDAWCEQVATIMRTKSPTSLSVTLRQLIAGKKLKFDDCMDIESRLTNRFIQGHDFFEGIRAAIIDKDHMPQWQPAKLEDVIDIDHYFSLLPEELSIVGKK